MDEITKAAETVTNQLPGNAPDKKHSMKKVGGLVQKSAGRKIAETFFTEDIDEFKKTFLKDMLVPALKDFAFSIVQRLFYGGGPKVNSGGFINIGSSLVRDYSPQQTAWTNYNKVSSQQQSQPLGKFDFSDLIFRDMSAAKDLINELKATIAYQGYVTVGDLYDSIDKVGYSDITNNYYGWRDVSSAQIRPVKTGYLVVLPKPIQVQ